MKASRGVGKKSQLYVAAKIYLKRILVNPKIVFDFDLALETLSCFLQMDLRKPHLSTATLPLVGIFAFQNLYKEAQYMSLQVLGSGELLFLQKNATDFTH